MDKGTLQTHFNVSCRDFFYQLFIHLRSPFVCEKDQLLWYNMKRLWRFFVRAKTRRFKVANSEQLYIKNEQKHAEPLMQC